MDPMLLQLLRGLAGRAATANRGLQGDYQDALKLQAQRAADADRARQAADKAGRRATLSVNKARQAKARLVAAQQVAQARLRSLAAATTPQQQRIRAAQLARAVGAVRTGVARMALARQQVVTTAQAAAASRARSGQATLAASAAARVAGGMAGVAGLAGAASGVANFVIGVVMAAAKLREFAETVSEEAVHIGRFNAGIQWEAFLTNVKQSQADIKTAKAIEPNVKRLEESRRRRIEAEQPIAEWWEKLKTDFATESNNFFAYLASILTKGHVFRGSGTYIPAARYIPANDDYKPSANPVGAANGGVLRPFLRKRG